MSDTTESEDHQKDFGIITIDGVVVYDGEAEAFGVKSRVGEKIDFPKDWWDEEDTEAGAEEKK